MPDTFLHLKGDKPPVGNDLDTSRVGAVQRTAPEGQHERAQRYVAGASRDAGDCRELLAALGLI